jgi:hypothetical protein
MTLTMKLSLLVPAVLAAALLPTAEAEASNYPPDYTSCGIEDYVTTGPFELIKETVDYETHARLTVAYRGYLRDYYADDEINLWIRLNGQDVFVAASSGIYDDAYAFFDSGPRGCAWTTPPNTSGVWVCSDPTPTEEHLFSWAFNGVSDQNAWDIEVAAEANGQWDSNWGTNFYGRFEPRNNCSY